MKEQPGLFLARNSVQGCVRTAQCDLSRFLCPTETKTNPPKDKGLRSLRQKNDHSERKMSTRTAMLRRNTTDKVIFKLKGLEYFLKISGMASPSG